MSTAQFTYVIDGGAIEAGRIDVQDLAPALLAVGELIRVANAEINGARAEISVKVQATKAGSFEIGLLLEQSFLEAAKSLLEQVVESKDAIATANDLLDLLFKSAAMAGPVGLGLFALIKKLRGRKPDKVERSENGKVEIHIAGDVFVTNAQVVKLAETVEVRESARKMLAALERDGIDELRAEIGEEEPLILKKNDVDSFDYNTSDTTEILSDQTREIGLEIVSLSFKEDNKWRVRDGADVISVAMEDADFLKRIANSEVNFAKGDYLLCDVRETQSSTPKGLKLERAIILVKEHRRAARQLRLL